MKAILSSSYSLLLARKGEAVSMKRSHGKHSKRSRRVRSKGRVAITSRMAEFKEGERVRISINPRFAEGMPFLRFNNRNAQVVSKQGSCFVLKVSDLGKEKTLVVANVHLARM